MSIFSPYVCIIFCSCISSGEALLKTDWKFNHREYDNISVKDVGNKLNLHVQLYVVKNIMILLLRTREFMSSRSANEQCCGNSSSFAYGT